ncbi:MAG: quinone oxidoreductase [Pseudomonadota bacterium]|nr:quinone oxidoreductase [Pseudomonadota bacterium]
MKAIVLKEHGGPEGLAVETRETPAPSPGEIVVANSVAGVNFIDIYQRRGLYPLSLPAVLGGEGAGVVKSVGAEVTALRPGDRVAWYGGGGGYAEETVLPAGMAAKIPDAVSDEIAAATFLKGLTAEMLARQVYPLKKGDRALIHAAAGGVGTLLVQWAKHLGAEIIAVVGSKAKEATARDAGAQHVIVRDETADIAAAVRSLTGGKGVEVVYDSVGAATFAASLDSLAMRGVMVSYGNASGPVPAFAPLELARRGSLFLTRPTLFHYATPDRLQQMAADLFAMLEKGVLRPAAPTVFPLEKAGEAQALLETGATTGSIVLKV